MSDNGKKRNGTGGQILTAIGGLLAGLGVVLALGVAGLAPAPAEASGKNMSRPPPRAMTPTNRTPTPRVTRPPNIRDSAMAGRNRPGGEDGVTLTDEEKEALELDELLDDLLWAIDPRQAAARSIMDEYLEAAARPENKDKTPDELMEQATTTVMERLFPIDEDTKGQKVDPEDHSDDAWTKGEVTEFVRDMGTNKILSDMRKGKSPVLAGRPGSMSRQAWDTHIEEKENIYQGRYDKEIKDKVTQRPDVRPHREANGDTFVITTRAAAAGLPSADKLSKKNGDSRSRREIVRVKKDPFGNQSSISHHTRDTHVIIVSEGGREVGVKVEFKRRGSYGGQQPVVYGADPTVPARLIEYKWWADAFNTNDAHKNLVKSNSNVQPTR